MYNVFTTDRDVAGRSEVHMNLGFADLSVSFNTQETLNAFSIKMLDKAMDTNEAIGQGIVEMIDSAAMERSVNPAVGSNFDMSV